MNLAVARGVGGAAHAADSSGAGYWVLTELNFATSHAHGAGCRSPSPQRFINLELICSGLLRILSRVQTYNRRAIAVTVCLVPIGRGMGDGEREMSDCECPNLHNVLQDTLLSNHVGH